MRLRLKELQTATVTGGGVHPQDVTVLTHMNGIICPVWPKWQTGAPWRPLPAAYGQGNAVYRH